MRSLRDRLATLQGSSTQPRPSVPRGVPIEAVEAGRDEVTPLGPVYVVDRFRDDADVTRLFHQGPFNPHPYLTAGTSLDPTDILFLDTETTGLAGGTGTHAFLIGLGYFAGERFVVRQLFMRGPSHERAMLDLLREVLDRFRLLVTFNGRTFDWPLLETRFIIHGYRERLALEHLDLLHPSRRLWRQRLQSCSLGNLEASLFAVNRDQDVPGFLIPQLYFDYLRDGDARRLRPVFAHNREDIVTMVRLTHLLARAAAEPAEVLQHPEDRIGMGLLLLGRGETLRGLDMLSEAIGDDALDPAVRQRAEVELTRGLKRLGRAPEAVPLWIAMCERSARRRVPDLYPFEELAKFYEHDARDLDAALRVVERALLLLELRGGSDVDRAGLLHRLERLSRRRASRNLRAPRAGMGDGELEAANFTAPA